MSLLGCSVVYKEKQLRRKEHKLKIIPVGGEAIVLALQSKEQTEQWLRVIHFTNSIVNFTIIGFDLFFIWLFLMMTLIHLLFVH